MLAAALSFYTMLALSPLLILIAAIADPILGRDAVRTQIVARFGERVGWGVASLIEKGFQGGQSGSGLWAWLIGLALMLLTTSRLFVHLQSSLNQLWEVPTPPPETFRETLRVFFARSVLVLLIVEVLLLIVLLIPTVLAAVRGWLAVPLPGGDWLWQLGGAIASLGMLTLLIGTLYRMLPERAIEWRDVSVGAAITALLFVFAQMLLSLYFAIDKPGVAYGAAGSLFVLLLWIYYQSQVFFLGAHFTHRYAMRCRAERGEEAPPVDRAFDQPG